MQELRRSVQQGLRMRYQRVVRTVSSAGIEPAIQKVLAAMLTEWRGQHYQMAPQTAAQAQRGTLPMRAYLGQHRKLPEVTRRGLIQRLQQVTAMRARYRQMIRMT
jgi:uncharacterized protein Smg (DUF494 family)